MYTKQEEGLLLAVEALKELGRDMQGEIEIIRKAMTTTMKDGKNPGSQITLELDSTQMLLVMTFFIIGAYETKGLSESIRAKMTESN